jgi:predicted short-subunit dehydrogenase-like oxidoreductase (DUF2520 family)
MNRKTGQFICYETGQFYLLLTRRNKYIDCFASLVVLSVTAWILDWTETDGTPFMIRVTFRPSVDYKREGLFEGRRMPATSVHKENIAIIGLGKTGTAVGYLLRKAGHPVVAVTCSSHTFLHDRIRYTGGKAFTADANAEAASLATCIFITTPDDSIAPVCREIVKKGGIKPGDKVIHMSGAGGLDLLESARKAGAKVASIHPLQSFADIEGAILNIPLSTFGITADVNLREWSAELVRDLGGIPFEVPAEVKPLYHAAACMASNYLTTLINAAVEIYLSLGLSRDEATGALWPLIAGTLKNIEAKGSVQALTGPISRGDAGTIEEHLSVFREKLPVYLPAYCAMGLLTLELSIKKNTITPESAEVIKIILKEDTL